MASRKFAFSLRGPCSILMPVVLCTLVLFRGDSVVSAQTSPQSSDEHLNMKEKRFHEYGQDFLDFAKSTPDTDERQYAMELVTVASDTFDRVDAAGVFLQIYRSLSCKEDRARINTTTLRIFETADFTGCEMDADSLALLAAKTGPASRIPYAWSMSDRVEPNVVVLSLCWKKPSRSTARS